MALLECLNCIACDAFGRQKSMAALECVFFNCIACDAFGRHKSMAALECLNCIACDAFGTQKSMVDTNIHAEHMTHPSVEENETLGNPTS